MWTKYLLKFKGCSRISYICKNYSAIAAVLEKATVGESTEIKVMIEICFW